MHIVIWVAKCPSGSSINIISWYFKDKIHKRISILIWYTIMKNQNRTYLISFTGLICRNVKVNLYELILNHVVAAVFQLNSLYNSYICSLSMIYHFNKCTNVASNIKITHNTKIWRNSHGFSPEMFVGLIGNPNRYRIAPVDFKRKRATVKFTTVDRMMVTEIELR